MLSDEDFVYKLHSEGIGYALIHYFGKSELLGRKDPELKQAVLEAEHALLKLNKVLETKFPDIEA